MRPTPPPCPPARALAASGETWSAGLCGFRPRPRISWREQGCPSRLQSPQGLGPLLFCVGPSTLHTSSLLSVQTGGLQVKTAPGSCQRMELEDAVMSFAHSSLWAFEQTGKWIKAMESNDLVRKRKGRRKWQPTPVFLPGESRGQGSLVGYCP